MARPRKPPRMERREENGIWEVVYFCPKANRTVHRSLGSADEVRAREKFAEWLVKNRPEEAKELPMTVADILAYYQDYAERECLSRDTISQNVRRLLPFFGQVPARSVDALKALAYTKMRREVDGVKDATIRNELSTLRTAYRRCAMDGYGGLTYVPMFSLPEGSAPKEDFIPKEQMAEILEALEAARGNAPISDAEAFIQIAFRTAARKTAVLELTWDRVDFARNVIDFRTAAWMALPRKRKTKRRTVVPMSEKLRAFMLQFASQRLPDDPDDRVIPISHTTLYDRLDDLAVHTKLPVRPHMLRRTFGSLASMAGTPTKEIARIMGNTEKVAEERYLRFNPEYLKDAVELD